MADYNFCMKLIIASACLFVLTIGQTPADDFYGKVTRGVSGNLSSALYVTPNPCGGLGHFQFRVGASDLVFEYPTYGEWSYLPVPTGVLAIGILRGKSKSQIVTGVLAVDVLLKAGLYPKQSRTEAARPFYSGGLKIGLLKNTLVTPAVALNLYYTQIDDLVFGYQDPNLEARYDKLRIADGNIALGKHIYGFFPYLALGYKYQMVKGRHIQRSAPSPEYVPYDANIGAFSGLVGAEWKVLGLGLNSEIIFSGTSPGIAIGIGRGW